MSREKNSFLRFARQERILFARYRRQHPHFRRNILIDALVSSLLVVTAFAAINHVSEYTRHQNLLRSGAIALSADELTNHVKSQSLDAYWFGPVKGYKYTIIYSDRREIIVSYVPQGVSLNLPDRYNLTVETYSKNLDSESPATSNLSSDRDDFVMSNGEVAGVYSDRPQRVRYSIPGTDKEVEVQYPSNTNIFDVYTGSARLKLISES